MRVDRFSCSLQRGFTLVEAMTAVLLVTVACTAMLLSVGQAMQASEANVDTCRANMLAQELMAEINTCRWADPTQPSHWGPESGEANTKTRVAFNDLDDYDGWSGPAQTRDGQVYDTVQQKLFPKVKSHEYKQYTCSVSVRYVSATGAVLPAGLTSPYRQVTATVTRAGQPAHRLSQIFEDHSGLLGSTHWFDPKAVEPVATVQIVP